MRIYLLNAPYRANFVRCGRWQGAATQGGGLAEQTHGDYVAFNDADCIPQKGWFENQACKFGNGIMGVRGGPEYRDRILEGGSRARSRHTPQTS